MTKQLLLLASAIGVLSMLGGIAGLSVFTDQEAVGGNAFDTGTVDISTSPTSAIVTFSNMAPGDTVTNDVTVTNAGSLELRYALSSTTTEDTLAAALDLTVWDENEESDAGTDCNATAPGTVLYGPADLGSTGATNVIGDATQGAQAGDRVLAASAAETLCFRVELPSSATGPQGASTTATFTFDAEQTTNNP